MELSHSDSTATSTVTLLSAGSVMSSPVRTIAPTATLEEAHHLLRRYGHSGLCVVQGDLAPVGIISRRDIDTALRHGFGRSAVSGFMSHSLKSATPATPLAQIQHLMQTYDIGRIPILESGRLVGIVTRTDLLRDYQSGLNLSGVAKAFDHTDRSLVTQLPSSETLCSELSAYLPDIWPVLMQLSEIAEQKGWSLYMVGGAVRDLLISLLAKAQVDARGKALTSATPSGTANDIDLVVEGAGEGTGVAFAEAVRARYPKVLLQVYGQFQTASLKWPVDGGDFLVLDIATARTEFYAYPAANPIVEASSLHQDLYRRDFTLNAMAICLGGASSARFQRGQLVDFFGGWLDLQKRQIKVLHNNSFVEDPTRIFRAVRFASRLGFELEPQTVRLIQYAIASGVYERVRKSHEKTPALQSRLAAELKYLLSESAWERSLMSASQLGALSCIHRDITLTPALWRQLRRMNRWLNKLHAESFVEKFNLTTPASEPPKWLLLLELIIAQLAVPIRIQVSKTLNLGEPSQRRLQNLHLWEATIAKQLTTTRRPSQLSTIFGKYERCELLLMGDRHPYTLGSKIWQYITQVSNQSPLITGRTLKQLGYEPGPQFRKILADVSDLSLDGELTSSQEAEFYVLAHYPLSRHLK